MNKKIAIIGGGIFGVSTYILLKQKGIDCFLFEKKGVYLEEPRQIILIEFILVIIILETT